MPTKHELKFSISEKEYAALCEEALRLNLRKVGDKKKEGLAPVLRRLLHEHMQTVSTPPQKASTPISNEEMTPEPPAPQVNPGVEGRHCRLWNRISSKYGYAHEGILRGYDEAYLTLEENGEMIVYKRQAIIATELLVEEGG